MEHCSTEAGTHDTYVRLIDVSFETSGVAIKAALQPYGTVLLQRRDKYMSSTENDYFQVMSGTVTAKMTLSRHVPSYLRIAEQRILVRYPGQPATCAIYNQPGHMAVNCPGKKGAQRLVGRWAEASTVLTKEREEAGADKKGAEGNNEKEEKNEPTPTEITNNRAKKLSEKNKKEKKAKGGKDGNGGNEVKEPEIQPQETEKRKPRDLWRPERARPERVNISGP